MTSLTLWQRSWYWWGKESNQTLSIVAGKLSGHDVSMPTYVSEVDVDHLSHALPLRARTVQELLHQCLVLTVHDFSILFAESRLQRFAGCEGQMVGSGIE